MGCNLDKVSNVFFDTSLTLFIFFPIQGYQLYHAVSYIPFSFPIRSFSIIAQKKGNRVFTLKFIRINNLFITLHFVSAVTMIFTLILFFFLDHHTIQVFPSFHQYSYKPTLIDHYHETFDGRLHCHSHICHLAFFLHYKSITHIDRQVRHPYNGILPVENRWL